MDNELEKFYLNVLNKYKINSKELVEILSLIKNSILIEKAERILSPKEIVNYKKFY